MIYFAKIVGNKWVIMKGRLMTKKEGGKLPIYMKMVMEIISGEAILVAARMLIKQEDLFIYRPDRKRFIPSVWVSNGSPSEIVMITNHEVSEGNDIGLASLSDDSIRTITFDDLHKNYRTLYNH